MADDCSQERSFIMALPTRTLADRPDLDQLRRQAKELLRAFLHGHADAVAEVSAHYHGADPATFALHDAQLVLARAYGFQSWPRLKAYIDGVTLRQLDEAIRTGNQSEVLAMLRARPELTGMGLDNRSLLHHPVLNRSAEMVRLLVEHGANARFGFYPHGEATSPLALALARSYHDIVAIIRHAEQRGSGAKTDAPGELFRTIVSGDEQGAIGMMGRNPELIHASTVEGWTPLHAASLALQEPLVAWLVEHGGNPNQRGKHELTPLDAAATCTWRGQSDVLHTRFMRIVERLLRAGAGMTARAAVALGDMQWIRERHVDGILPGPLDGTGGLLRVAITHDQPAMLELLLDLGFDPDERVRVPGSDEVEHSWGFPLWECAATGKHAMAELLLNRRADPNAQVYASGSPVSEAYGQRDSQMIALLERYGGFADVGMAALYRNTDLARRLFVGAENTREAAERLLGGAACGGLPEMVQLALTYIDWPRDDPRWFGILEQPLRLWNHGPGHWCHPEWDRSSYLTCFRLLLERCDPNVRGRKPDGGQFGLTILHSVAGSREHMTADERVAFATMLLDAGARLDIRDNLLKSTPLGWACRWGRPELVELFLKRGADPVEADAEPWATPRAWAEKMHHPEALAILSSVT
jgi:ankyrin repeat protein